MSTIGCHPSQRKRGRLDAYRRDIFWRQYEEAIKRLQNDAEAWADYVGEQEVEASALRDGLEPE